MEIEVLTLTSIRRPADIVLLSSDIFRTATFYVFLAIHIVYVLQLIVFFVLDRRVDEKLREIRLRQLDAAGHANEVCFVWDLLAALFLVCLLNYDC